MDIRRMDDSSTAKNINGGKKKSVCLSVEGGQEVFGSPQFDRIIPRQSCAILRVAGAAPWTRESPWVRGEVVGPRGVV